MTPRLLIAAAAIFAALCGQGSVPAGSWRVYPSFASPAMQVVETGSKVFYLAGGGLFSYDKSTQETFGYTTDNSLSDHIVDAIYPHPQEDCIVVCYSNGNMDVVGGEGEVVNLSDIKDASLSGSKRINDIAVEGARIYAATDFGVVIFDIGSRKVVDSGNFSKPVTGIAVTPDNIVISVGDELRTIAKGNRIAKLDSWSTAGSPGAFAELAADGDAIIGRTASRVKRITLNTDGTASIDDIGESNQHLLLSGGKVRYSNGSYIGTNGKTVYLPSDALNNIVGGIDPEQNLWALSSDGIASWLRSGSDWSILSERARPYAMSVLEASYIIPSADGERIYFTNLGPTNYRKAASTANDGVFFQQQTTLITGTELSDVSATEVTPGEITSQFPPSTLRRAAATTRIAESPSQPDTYYIGTGNDGLYKVVGGKYSGRYDASNSPMGTPWGSRVYEVSFDRSGNMWVGADGLTATSSVMVLPAMKAAADPAMVSHSDWIVPNIAGFENGKDIRIFHCRKSDMVFIFSYNYNQNFVAYHTNGTPDNFNDDKALLWNELTDTDGKNFTPTYISAIAEDADGRVWMGTTEGVFEITRPEDAISPAMQVRRLKIDHGDGTGLADYFAGTDLVLDISVDGANRKWVATEGSGVYLVNAAGNEILRHFTSDNSPLPARRVNAVYADPLSNSVYFATPGGVMEYGSDATAPAADFSAIKVYPNPVTPDYGGDVTIEGLMDGSLVKIADSAGSVVWQGRAEGGMITWSVENSAGRRVRSGVYYIFAGSAEGSGGKGAVAKVMVVN